MYRLLSSAVLLSWSLFPSLATAQADGMVAYVPQRPIHRTADNEKIAFVESAVAGKVEASLPEDAFRIDILNARGNVKRSYEGKELSSFSLNELRPGTWTLRARTPSGYLVRRFVILEQGKVVWSPEASTRKRRSGSRH